MSAFVAIALLSGCVGGDDEGKAAGPDVAEKAEDVQTTATTGSITGTLTSDLFEPLAGGLVTIVETGQSTRVAKNGFFTINEIEPGAYTLDFVAEGYQSGTRRVEVISGEVVDVRMQLIPLAGAEAWTEVIERSGQITYGVAWQVAPGGSCVPAGCNALTGNGVYSSIKVNATDDVETHLVELVWTPAGLLGEHLFMTYRCPDKGDPCSVGAEGTTSPLVVRRDKADWEVGDNGTNRWFGDWTAGTATSTGLIGTGDMVGVDVGAAYEQKFTWYITLFHHERAPDGYTGIPE